MKCPNCGLDLPEDSDFCQYCGTRITSFTGQNTGNPFVTASSTITIPQKQIPISDSVQTATPATQVEPVVNNHKSSERKTSYCKKCGGIIDSQTNTCQNCGKHYIRTGKTIVTILLVLVLCSLVGLNIFQYMASIENNRVIQQLNSTIADQTATIADRDSSIASRDSQISKLQKDLTAKSADAENYLKITNAVGSIGTLGYAANNFKTSDPIIVVSQYDTSRKFTLTANWPNRGTVSVDYDKSFPSAWVSFDNNSWSTSTTMTIKPNSKGVTVITFSNNVNSQKFKMIIIVK